MKKFLVLQLGLIMALSASNAFAAPEVKDDSKKQGEVNTLDQTRENEAIRGAKSKSAADRAKNSGSAASDLSDDSNNHQFEAQLLNTPEAAAKAKKSIAQLQTLSATPGKIGSKYADAIKSVLSDSKYKDANGNLDESKFLAMVDDIAAKTGKTRQQILDNCGNS